MITGHEIHELYLKKTRQELFSDGDSCELRELRKKYSSKNEHFEEFNLFEGSVTIEPRVSPEKISYFNEVLEDIKFPYGISDDGSQMVFKESEKYRDIYVKMCYFLEMYAKEDNIFNGIIRTEEDCYQGRKIVLIIKDNKVDIAEFHWITSDRKPLLDTVLSISDIELLDLINKKTKKS
jgi:hypothetical protein